MLFITCDIFTCEKCETQIAHSNMIFEPFDTINYKLVHINSHVKLIDS